ncbi:MAG: type II toxin-antitoxin system HicB family antitoxin [Deltaproteobacteria bacterium]|nr:type II toxin-antitoxin system HicB family antitoxin [Deltaproteobacteria bacterium]
MRRQFTYPAVVERDQSGRFLVTFPDLPGAATDGKSIEEALIEAADCLEEAIANLIALEEEIPKPSRAKRGQHLIATPAKMAAKAALYLAIQEAGISKSELARRIGCDVREVRRLLDPLHASKVDRIEQALAAVGQCLAVEMRAIP